MAARMGRWALVVWLQCLSLSAVSPLYFHLQDGQQRCFIQEVPEDVVVTGNHHIRLLREEDEQPTCQNSSLSIEAKDPENEVVPLRFSSERSFFFTAMKPGAHRICLLFSCPQRPLSAGHLLEVHLDVRASEGPGCIRRAAGSKQLPLLWRNVQQLTQKAVLIQKQLHYHRLRHKVFQEVSHNTDMWIFWWPVVRSLYVVLFIMCATRSW